MWLQNDNGFHTYKPTDIAVDAFLDAYRPGRDKNFDTTVAECAPVSSVAHSNSESNNTIKTI